MKNIQHISFENPDKVLIPQLHIKLRLMKNFVKAMGKHHSNGFKFLCKKFSQLSHTKLKEESFVGLQIRKVLEDLEFEKTLNILEPRALHAFKWICVNFLGNFKSPSYQECVAKLMMMMMIFYSRLVTIFKYMQCTLSKA